MSEQKSFLATLPGLLTAAAGLITAIGGLLLALQQTGVINLAKSTATPTPAPAIPTHAPARPARSIVDATPAEQTTDGWAIIGNAEHGQFFDLLLKVPSGVPAVGGRYEVLRRFRVVQNDPHDSGQSGQTITLGVVNPGDRVEVLDLYVPVPSTRSVFVHAKLRTVLRPLNAP